MPKIHSWACKLEIPIISGQFLYFTQEETEANLSQKTDKGAGGRDLGGSVG